MTTGKRASAAALVALVALSSGCDASGGGTARQPVVTVTPAPIETSSPAPTPTPATQPSGSAPESVATGPTRRVESSGISVAVPARWLELDAAELSHGAAGTHGLSELAEQSGVTVDQLVTSLEGMDLALFDTQGTPGEYPDNLTVLAVPGQQPTGTLVEFSLLQIGAGDVLTTHVDTALGDAVSATYELEVGPTTIHGAMVVVQSGGRTAAITISAHDEATARHLAAVVTDTVKAADPAVS